MTRNTFPASILGTFIGAIQYAAVRWRARIEQRHQHIALKRAYRGAEAIEAHYGFGVVARLDVENLDVGNPERCTLAQICGEYELAPWRLRRIGYGVRDSDFIRYAHLNTAWRTVIADYRKRAGLQDPPMRQSLAA